MPTLVLVEGFEHQTASVDRFGGAVDKGIFSIIDTASRITFDTTDKRSGAAALKITQNGTNSSRAILGHPSTAILVVSLYFRIVSAPSVQSRLLEGGTIEAGVEIATDGTIRLRQSGGSIQTGPNVADGEWHRLDYLLNRTATTHTCDWEVDGVAQTQSTRTGQTAGATTVNFALGSFATTNTMTVWFDDLVISATSGDYPLGPHKVLSSVPMDDGTHNAGTDGMEDTAGADINGTTVEAWPLMDEWPAGSDRVQQNGTGTGEYAEVLFEDATETTIWAVVGFAALSSATTTANNGTTRVVDVDGTTLTNIYAGDMSSTAPHYRRALVAVPGGGSWDQTKFNGLKVRVGFSSDGSPIPYWNSLLLQYAVPEVPGLEVASAAHAQTADGVALTQVHVLAISSGAHAQVADNLTLEAPSGANLVVDAASHAHAAGSPAVTQVHVLVVQSAAHAQTSTSPALTQVHVLVISAAAHDHAAAVLALTQVYPSVIEVSDGEHGHAAGLLVLTQVHQLAVQLASHAQMVEPVHMYRLGGGHIGRAVSHGTFFGLKNRKRVRLDKEQDR